MVAIAQTALLPARLADWAHGRTLLDRRSGPAYVCIAAMAGVAAVLAHLLGYRWDAAFVSGLTLALATFIALSMAARWIGFARLATASESCLLLLAISALTSMTAFIAAGLALPLVDDSLAQVDRALFGFDRSMVVRLTQDWPGLHGLSIRIYNTLSLQPFALLPALCLLGKDRLAWRFLLAWSLTLAACVAISPFMPAHGGPPYALSWQDVFDGARDGTRRVIDSSVLTGIITFPSFHAAGATLLAWGGRWLPLLRWPMVMLNVAVAITAVIVGGHYVTDIVAGAGVAAMAIWLSGGPAILRVRSSRTVRAG